MWIVFLLVGAFVILVALHRASKRADRLRQEMAEENGAPPPGRRLNGRARDERKIVHTARGGRVSRSERVDDDPELAAAIYGASELLDDGDDDVEAGSPDLVDGDMEFSAAESELAADLGVSADFDPDRKLAAFDPPSTPSYDALSLPDVPSSTPSYDPPSYSGGSSYDGGGGGFSGGDFGGGGGDFGGGF